jgi:tRNA pseudouridine13 synthase
MNDLAYLHGKPISTGDLRTHKSDFKVFELLPFQASGDGEHLFLHIKKTGVNTGFVAKQLASYFSVKDFAVSYAGLKDRFAVCEQYFSVHLPGKNITDLSNLQIDGVEILSLQRHNKKLRIGSLLGNRFELTLRNVTDIEALKERWKIISEIGVPNYFGEQRFGIDGGNLERAKTLFSGQKVKDKKKRGMYISAARSFLFNDVVNQRINNQTFDRFMIGDVAMLSGTQSVFVSDVVDETLIKRHQEGDIDITAPMWGRGRLMSTHDVLLLEQAVADTHDTFSQGLEHAGLNQERRKIRLSLQMPKLSVDGTTVVLSFCLPSGCYATTILRELIHYQDLTQRFNAHQA